MLTILFSPLINSIPNFVATTSPVIVKITEATNHLDSAAIVITDSQGNNLVSYTQSHDPILPTSYNTVTFDIREVLQDQLGFDLQPIGGGGAVAAPNSMFGYSVLVEGYYTDPSTQVQTIGLATYPSSGLVYALSATLTQLQTQADMAQYALGNNGTIRFLTNTPVAKWVTPSCSEYLGTIIDATVIGYYAHFEKKQQDQSISVLNLSLDSIAASSKRFDIGVGPTNLQTLSPAFLDDDTLQYSVELASLGSNVFVDGVNGTMEGSVAGLSSWIAATTVTHHTGTYCGRMNGASIYQNPLLTSLYTIVDHDTQLQLQTDTTYVFEAWIKVEQQTGYVTPTDLKILPSFVLGGFDGVQPIIMDFIDINVGYIFDQWLPIRMQFTTGSSTASSQGYIRILGTGTATCFQKVYISVDDITVKKQISHSETKTFVLDRACYPSPTRVHFLNRLGAMDSYTFIGTEKKKLKTTASYAQLYRSGTATISQPGRITQSVDVAETLICNSGALTDEEMAWLEELLTSPRIFIERDGNYLPVIIKAGDYETLDSEDNTKSLKVELSLANALALQRN